MSNPEEHPESAEPTPGELEQAARTRNLLILLTAILVIVPLVFGALRLAGYL